MFKIDETDFGIDQKKSTFELKVLKSGEAIIDVEVYGCKERYAEITEDFDNTPWSWTLYPPHFYIRSYPMKSGQTAGTFKANISTEDLDEHEVAIYLMDHNDVDEVNLTVDQHGFTANGFMFLSGKPVPFSISFKKNETPNLTL